MLSLAITAIIMGLFKAVQNALMFYPNGWQSKFYNKWFNVPSKTYNNKIIFPLPAYEIDEKIINWLFENPFVFVTDFWHLADFVVFMGIPVWASIYFHNYYILLLFYFAFTIPFSLLFNSLKPKE